MFSASGPLFVNTYTYTHIASTCFQHGNFTVIDKTTLYLKLLYVSKFMFAPKLILYDSVQDAQV